MPDPRAVFEVLDRYREPLETWLEGVGWYVGDELELTDLAMRLLTELAAGRAEADDPPRKSEEG
jgi:hypothetical protein